MHASDFIDRRTKLIRAFKCGIIKRNIAVMELIKLFKMAQVNQSDDLQKANELLGK